MTNSIQEIEAVEVIKSKLLGKELTYKQIFTLMDEISHHRMSDVLTTYFVAASFKEGFTEKELVFITQAMVETGTRLNFKGIVADKHSIGGVAGTRTTMIVVPIVAACGFKIPKISSRAITTPAGTADTMEVLAPVDHTPQSVERIVNKVGGCVVWNGTMNIAPADDIIIKIEEPLSFESFDKIIVSVMAKKIASGANHLILDIPLGKTMKVKYQKDAELVAHKFQLIGKEFGIHIITDINHTTEPAGNGIGPVMECIDVLKVLEQQPDRPTELEERALRLAGKLLDICYKDAKIDKDGQKTAKEILQNKTALKKFKEIIAAQGGNPDIDSTSIPVSSTKKEILATHSGKIKAINNFNLNAIAKILGAPGDKIAGMFLRTRTGKRIVKNEPLVTFYARDAYKLSEAIDTYKNLPIFDIQHE